MSWLARPVAAQVPGGETGQLAGATSDQNRAGGAGRRCPVARVRRVPGAGRGATADGRSAGARALAAAKGKLRLPGTERGEQRPARDLGRIGVARCRQVDEDQLAGVSELRGAEQARAAAAPGRGHSFTWPVATAPCVTTTSRAGRSSRQPPPRQLQRCPVSSRASTPSSVPVLSCAAVPIPASTVSGVGSPASTAAASPARSG